MPSRSPSAHTSSHTVSPQVTSNLVMMLKASDGHFTGTQICVFLHPIFCPQVTSNSVMLLDEALQTPLLTFPHTSPPLRLRSTMTLWCCWRRLAPTRTSSHTPCIHTFPHLSTLPTGHPRLCGAARGVWRQRAHRAPLLRIVPPPATVRQRRPRAPHAGADGPELVPEQY